MEQIIGFIKYLFMTVIYPIFIPPKQRIIINTHLDEHDPNRERMIVRHEVNERLTKFTKLLKKTFRINDNNKYIKTIKHALKKINSAFIRFKYLANKALKHISIFAGKVTGVEWYHLFIDITKKQNRLPLKRRRNDNNNQQNKNEEQQNEREKGQNKNRARQNINTMLQELFQKTYNQYKEDKTKTSTEEEKEEEEEEIKEVKQSQRKRSNSLLEQCQNKIAKTLPIIGKKIRRLVKGKKVDKTEKNSEYTIVKPEYNIIDEVPDELMIHIFTYYGEYHQVATNLKLVCQQFKEVIEHPYILKYYHTKIPTSFLEHYKLQFEDDDRKNQPAYMLYFWANHSFDYIHHLQLEQQNRKQAYQQQLDFLRQQQQQDEESEEEIQHNNNIITFDDKRESKIIQDQTIAARWMVKLNGLWKGHIFLAGEEQPYLKCRIDPGIVGNHSFLNDMVLVEGTVESVTWASESSNYTEISLNISRISGDNYTWFHAFQYLIAATGLTVLMIIVAFVICAIGQMVTLGAIIFYAGKFCMYLTLCLYHLSVHVYEKKRREYVYLTDSIDSTDPLPYL